ncbi:MAG TPA: hypothetical protein VGF60_21810, partial [Xanthobacteraceae bacterium]
MLDPTRRELIFLVGAAAAWPLSARGQPPERKRLIGWVIGMSGEDVEAQARLVVFREALAALGWIDGRNADIVARFGTADPDRNRAAIGELLRRQSDAIVTSNPLTVSTLMQETR